MKIASKRSDHLSPICALYLYRAQRNNQIDESVAQMSKSFEILQPKRKSLSLYDSLTSFDSNNELLDLDDDLKEKEADTEDSTMKKALHLSRKTQLFT